MIPTCFVNHFLSNIMNCVDYLLTDIGNSEKLFVLGPKETLSFKLLKERVAKLTLWIKKEVGQGEKVVLISPNSNFFIVSYLAIMKSGNVVVPLNPAIEKEGLDYVLEQGEVSFSFMSQAVVRRLQPEIENIIDEKILSRIEEDLPMDKWEVENSFEENSLAQIIYTSGSTALPKGVMLSHKNIKANTSSIIEYLKLTEHDIMEVVLPFFYCYGLSLLHTHLKVRGSIVMNNNFIFLGSVINDLKKYNCTGFAGVPSHFQILLRKSDSFIKSEFPSLKYVTQAGGKLHKVFIEEFRNYFPNVGFFVMYGQTEATARLSYLPPERLDDKLGSLGKGIPGVKLEVVDGEGVPVTPGEVGEIIAKGDNVMLGYFKDAQATRETIKEGWLYTGDLAKVDEEGFIYHAARRKEIIKVGGRRVSPKEIEEVLVSMHGVVDCTIEAVDDDILGEAIKAILVVNTANHTITADGVKAFCSTKLASYKIPGVIAFKDRVEVNAAGKKVKKKSI